MVEYRLKAILLVAFNRWGYFLLHGGVAPFSYIARTLLPVGHASGHSCAVMMASQTVENGHLPELPCFVASGALWPLDDILYHFPKETLSQAICGSRFLAAPACSKLFWRNRPNKKPTSLLWPVGW